jgi:hypothetical protein
MYALEKAMNDEDLVAQVKDYPCLYDVTSKEFKDQPKKIIAWKRIADATSSGKFYNR